MTGVANLSGRQLLKSLRPGSGLVLGVHVSFRQFPFANAAEASGRQFQPNVFLSIDEYGLVTIVATRAEMGTGIKQHLPLVLADELEADWSRVKIVQAQGDPKDGDQNTDGSRSTWQFFGPIRLAGATARQMLETAAAEIWQVPVGQCQAQNGFVVHAASGRKFAFGDLAKLAAAMPVPPADRVRLKDRTEWRYIGKPHPIVDLDDIVHGRMHRHRRAGHEIRLDRALPGLWRQSLGPSMPKLPSRSPASSVSSRSRRPRCRPTSSRWAASR